MQQMDEEILTDKLCEYGCGLIAKYKFKNGKLCCSEKFVICLSRNNNPMSGSHHDKETKKKMRKPRNNMVKPIQIETDKLCSFGCGNIAKYKFNHNDNICCSFNLTSCPTIREKIVISSKNKKPSLSIETNDLCSFGCGNIAKYEFNNGKLCCSKSQNSCSHMKEINKISTEKHARKTAIKSKKIKIEKGIITADELLPNFQNYRRKVANFTTKSIKKYFSKEDLKNRSRHGLNSTHVDHILSVFEGFKNYIPPYIIGHICNLRIIPSNDNYVKNRRSDKSLDVLHSEVLNHGVEYYDYH
jgi:hypothetical protein